MHAALPTSTLDSQEVIHLILSAAVTLSEIYSNMKHWQKKKTKIAPVLNYKHCDVEAYGGVAV